MAGRVLDNTKGNLFFRPIGKNKKALKNFFKAFVLIPAMTYSPTQFPGQYHWR